MLKNMMVSLYSDKSLLEDLLLVSVSIDVFCDC